MRRPSVATAPPSGWEVVSEVDSRLEGDLFVRLLAARSVEGLLVERSSGDFAVFVHPDDRDRAAKTLTLE